MTHEVKKRKQPELAFRKPQSNLIVVRKPAKLRDSLPEPEPDTELDVVWDLDEECPF